jgi:hypothetical protein
MDAVERAFMSAVEDLNAGRAEPVERYLELVTSGERDELADMLAAIFASRPPEPEQEVTLDSPSYLRALAVLDEVSESAGAAGVLPGALVELRDARGLTPDEVTHVLAEHLAIPPAEQRRLDWQYFRLESGQLAGLTLSRRLLEALAEIFGAVAEDFLAASEVRGRPSPLTPAQTFARPAGAPTSAPSGAAHEQHDADAGVQLVDRLFTGGRDA